MKSFRERNPVILGLIGIVVLGLAFMAAFFSDRLPVIGAGTAYAAEFREAAGIRPDDPVEVAGIKVGKVTSVKLDKGKVKVTFRLKDVSLGNQTVGAIKIRTLLGQKYLDLDPQGGVPQEPSQAIPLNRTLSPFDILDAFNGLSSTLNQVDTAQLAKSFQVLSETFRNTPKDVRGALQGLSGLSNTISSRSTQISQLLSNSNQFSKTLSDRNAEFEKLLGDGSQLFSELQQRKAAITALLEGTRKLSAQLVGLVQDNTAQLKPALTQLDKVTTMLRQNQESLAKGLQGLAPYLKLFNNAVGDGRWINVFSCGIDNPGSATCAGATQ